jgi:hypothetical protein
VASIHVHNRSPQKSNNLRWNQHKHQHVHTLLQIIKKNEITIIVLISSKKPKNTLPEIERVVVMLSIARNLPFSLPRSARAKGWDAEWHIINLHIHKLCTATVIAR